MITVAEPEPIIRSDIIIPEPVRPATPVLLDSAKLQEDIPEEPEKCFGPESKETILPEVVKEAEPTEDLPELIKLATELVQVSSPEVEVIGSMSDIETVGSSFCGTADPSNLQDYEVKEDSPATEAP